MAQYSEEWFYPTGQLATNQRAIVFGPGDDNAVAPIFSDPAMTVPLANPTVTDANGMLTFYAADGTYWIWVGPTTGGNGIEINLGASPDNPVLSVNGIGPDGGGNVTLTAADVDAQPITTIDAVGDLYVGTGPDATTRLPIGSAGEVLTVVAGVPSWEPGGGGAVDSVNGQTGVVVLTAADVGAQPIATIDAAGDLYVGTGPDATTRLPIGSAGEVLTVVAGTPSWEPAPADAVTSVNGQTGVVVLDAGDVGAVPTSRTITTQNGLTGGGDLSANRTFEPVYGTGANTVAQGNDTRIVNAIQQTLFDAKGDLIAASAADTPVRVGPIGANGTVLTADSGQSSGMAWTAIPGKTVTETIEFNDDRPVLTTGNGQARWYCRQGSWTITGVWVSAGVVPTGADIIVDVNLNGSTIYSTQANRPTVPATTNGGTLSATPDTTAVANGDYFTVDIDQIGSTIAGGRIVVGIVMTQSV